MNSFLLIVQIIFFQLFFFEVSSQESRIKTSKNNLPIESKFLSEIDKISIKNPYHPYSCSNNNFNFETSKKDSTKCKQRIKFLESKLKQIQDQQTDTFMNELFKTNRANKEKKILVIADFHYTPVQEKYHYILFKIKKNWPQLNCLFVEFPSSLKEVLNKIAKNELTSKNSALMLAKALKAAHLLDINIIPVDNSVARDQVQNADTISTRNFAIAEELHKNFENKTCTTGVLIIGAEHLFSNKKYKNLNSYLKEKNISITSILPLDTGIDPRTSQPVSFWHNPDCKTNPPLIEKAILFSNKFEKKILFHPNGGFWQDFDWTWILPPMFDYKCNFASK